MKLNGIFPPAGTILGPDWSGGFLTVYGTNDQGVELRRSTQSDFDAVPESPRSVTEHKMIVRS